jgi:hypothetical protein
MIENRKIIDYQIVNFFFDYSSWGDDECTAEKRMKKFIDLGYEPYGHLVLNQYSCVQAMIKYESYEERDQRVSGLMQQAEEMQRAAIKRSHEAQEREDN